MASRIYNQFYTGLWQDDFLTGWPKLIDSKNLDWLQTGYWVTLWPKVNKLVYSNAALRWINLWALSSTPVDTQHLTFWDSWEVYNIWNPVDNTPDYTFTTWWKVRGAFLIQPYRYFLYEATAWNNTLNLAQVLESRVEDGTYTGINETYDTNFVVHYDNPPILQTAKITYIGWLDVVKNLNASWTIWTSYTWVNRYVTGLTKHLTQFTMYTSWNEVYYATETAMVSWWVQSWSNILDFQPRRAIQSANVDYIVAREWQLQIWGWTQTQEISKPRLSDRLEDNSSFQTIFNFDPWSDVAWNMMTFARGKLYIAVNDATPWIMVYWSIINWVQAWFNKSICVASTWEDIEVVYAVDYEHTRNRVYFTYKTATKYWLDYIDIDSKETTQLWYWVTEVFSANTAYIKKPSQERITTSNTSWDNYVKEYIRINNWAWELVKTINDVTDTIARHEIKAQYKKNNIDIQFKFEIYNDLQDETWPIVQELLYDYTILPQ